jgi:hypothetical protein
MRHHPERTAWAVLLGSFCTFCLLVISIPAGVRWWVLSSTQDQLITMVSSGAVLVTRPGRTTAEANLTDIPPGSFVNTDADAQATLTFMDRNSRAVLALVKIYGSTAVTILRADSPRFRAGDLPHWIRIQVAASADAAAGTAGRVRVTSVAADKQHDVKIELVSSPNVITTLGSPASEVSLDAGAQSMMTVEEGQAAIDPLTTDPPVAKGLVLLQGERAEASAAGIQGPFSTEREFIANGKFEQPLGTAWMEETPQQLDNISGTVAIEDADGRQIVHFYRQGIQLNWGQVGISQNINQDVRDFKTLRLQLDVLLSNQDLFNCGSMGTECPVMVKITFLDVYGNQQTWIKGYYYNFSPDTGLTKCPSCGAVGSAEHQQVPHGEWRTVETDNLVDVFRNAGVPAARILSLSIEASGHAFDSSVTEVHLLGSE